MSYAISVLIAVCVMELFGRAYGSNSSLHIHDSPCDKNGEHWTQIPVLNRTGVIVCCVCL